MNRMNGIRRIRDEDEHGWAWKLTKIGVDVRDQILKKSPYIYRHIYMYIYIYTASRQSCILQCFGVSKPKNILSHVKDYQLRR